MNRIRLGGRVKQNKGKKKGGVRINQQTEKQDRHAVLIKDTKACGKA